MLFHWAIKHSAGHVVRHRLSNCSSSLRFCRRFVKKEKKKEEEEEEKNVFGFELM